MNVFITLFYMNASVAMVKKHNTGDIIKSYSRRFVSIEAITNQ